MAKWSVINNPLNSTAQTFGGRWGNDISRYLNGIDMGAIDPDKEPIIRTTTRFGQGKLKFYDNDSTHTFEIQSDNIVTGSNRIFKFRIGPLTSDYILTDEGSATIKNKVLGTNITLGSALNASGQSINHINEVGLRDLDGENVSVLNIEGDGANSNLSILKDYQGILGADDIRIKFGESSKIHKYEWYTSVPGSNTKVFDIQPTEINMYVPLNMNGNELTNYSVTLEPDSVGNTQIATHTSSKISITNKAQLNSSILYSDVNNSLGAHYLDITKMTAPGSPASDNLRVYVDTVDNHLKHKNSSGNVVDITAATEGGIEPIDHALSHMAGGGDMIKVNELGAPTTNIPTTDATETANGTLRVLSGVATEYLDGSGAWSVPAGSVGSLLGEIQGNVRLESGDGIDKTFVFPHGLTSTPATVLVRPISINAFGEFETSWDATNITVTYQNAPPAGTDNLKFSWIAMDPTVNLGGEANTASSTGTGVILTKTKTGVNLPFRSLIAGSSKLTLTQNTNDITIDVDEAAFATSRPPTAHAVSHKDGGSDQIKINELAASTTNNIATNSTTTVNGTLPMLSGNANDFLNGEGEWINPPGVGDLTASNLAGTTGAVGFFKQKSGLNFEFKKLKPASTRVTLVDDTVNNEVVFDVNDENLSIQYTQLTAVPTTIVETDQNNTYQTGFLQTYPTNTIKIMNPAGTYGTILGNSSVVADRVLAFPLLTGDDTIAVTSLEQTLLNKELILPEIAEVLNGDATITMPISTTKIIGTNTIDTVSAKTMVLTDNTITDTGAVVGAIPVHNGTRFVAINKGADGTFFGVSGGSAGFFTPAVGGGGALPDGSQIPTTGRWGGLYGGRQSGSGIFDLTKTVTGSTSYTIHSPTETSTDISTASDDDSIAEFKTTPIFSRQSNPVFKAKWALKQNNNMSVFIGFTNASSIPTGSGHDQPLNNSEGIAVVSKLDTESVYYIARNGGSATQMRTNSGISSVNTVTHTVIMQMFSDRIEVTLDGTLFTYTLNIPNLTTPLYAYMHIEAIGSSSKAIQIFREQITML